MPGASVAGISNDASIWGRGKRRKARELLCANAGTPDSTFPERNGSRSKVFEKLRECMK